MTLPINRSRRRRVATLAIATAVAATAAVMGAGAAQAAPGRGDVRPAGTAAVADSYIVVLRESAALRGQGVPAAAGQLAGRYGGTVGHVYQHALRGFEVSMSLAAARRLAADPTVAYVEQNSVYTANGTQSPVPSWGLDRIDQRNLPLDNSYTFPTTASGVRAYIIDTGIRFSHADFGGRAVSGFDAIDGGTADDCNGHGTHLAGTVGGSTYGVAKGVTLVAVRVLSCAGSATTAQVVSGIDWVTGDHDPGELAVANLSLGGGANTTLDTAVANSIADGVTYSVSAGASNSDACNFSPARVPAAITVAATDMNDARASFANFGTCLDLFAPGVGITSTWFTSDTATATLSGTSMATAHVTGAAALVLAQNPTFTPQQVRDFLVNNATMGVVTNPGTGSPNRLLFVVNNGGGCASPGQKLVNPGFESGPTGWTASTGVIGQWGQSGQPPRTGSWNAWLGGNGFTSTEQLFQTVALPPGCSNYLLAFWLHIDTAETASSVRDRLRVQVLSTGGTVLATLATYSNLNAAPGYGLKALNLSNWAGQTIRVRWLSQENSSRQTSFVIDDTALNVS